MLLSPFHNNGGLNFLFYTRQKKLMIKWKKNHNFIRTKIVHKNFHLKNEVHDSDYIANEKKYIDGNYSWNFIGTEIKNIILKMFKWLIWLFNFFLFSLIFYLFKSLI